MNPEQQRIAIAEAVGKDADYLNDLNAMHEVEKALGDYWPTYCEWLFEVVEPEPKFIDVTRYWNLLHATASQRAEAFLRTIGKWEEGK